MGEYQTSRGSQLNEVFGAMADPTRRAILARLSLSEARVTELAADFPISLNSTSKHIKLLERAGLVTRSVRGRDHVLTLNAAPLAEAAECIDYFRQFWEERLEALEQFVLAKKKSQALAGKPTQSKPSRTQRKKS